MTDSKMTGNLPLEFALNVDVEGSRDKKSHFYPESHLPVAEHCLFAFCCCFVFQLVLVPEYIPVSIS